MHISLARPTILGFQFQIGAIKRSSDEQIIVEEKKFQFQIGAIKSGIPKQKPGGLTKVSIPNWCD